MTGRAQDCKSTRQNSVNNHVLHSTITIFEIRPIKHKDTKNRQIHNSSTYILIAVSRACIGLISL